MIIKHSLRLVTIVFALVFVPTIVFAHQPRLTTSTSTAVIDPEISKAYYGQLTGEPHVYHFKADAPFNLYVSILVPDITGQKTDVSAAIIKDGNLDYPLEVLGGPVATWQKFYEPFGRDNYLTASEYKAKATAGEYEIRVWSSNNDSKYSLAIGEIEAFDFAETVNAVKLIPELKQNFFLESPAGFILSPFGIGYILIMFILAFVVGLVYRLLMKVLAKKTGRGAPRNIGLADKILRVVLGVGLLGWAITTTWSPVLLFFAGFCFFEAIFSWCGIYAAIGRNTCPV